MAERIPLQQGTRYLVERFEILCTVSTHNFMHPQLLSSTSTATPNPATRTAPTQPKQPPTPHLPTTSCRTPSAATSGPVVRPHDSRRDPRGRTIAAADKQPGPTFPTRHEESSTWAVSNTLPLLQTAPLECDDASGSAAIRGPPSDHQEIPRSCALFGQNRLHPRAACLDASFLLAQVRGPWFFRSCCSRRTRWWDPAPRLVDRDGGWSGCFLPCPSGRGCGRIEIALLLLRVGKRWHVGTA